MMRRLLAYCTSGHWALVVAALFLVYAIIFLHSVRISTTLNALLAGESSLETRVLGEGLLLPNLWIDFTLLSAEEAGSDELLRQHASQADITVVAVSSEERSTVDWPTFLARYERLLPSESFLLLLTSLVEDRSVLEGLRGLSLPQLGTTHLQSYPLPDQQTVLYVESVTGAVPTSVKQVPHAVFIVDRADEEMSKDENYYFLRLQSFVVACSRDYSLLLFPACTERVRSFLKASGKKISTNGGMTVQWRCVEWGSVMQVLPSLKRHTSLTK
ncbi:hypothetical protein ADEAN_000977500 [Angomonas deanei]|uniref:Uncharacterized protein n=1 Tax=Angomonas deanei TaxID=59799 RepID=A0A7G2CRU0_9TRYP|nr:hypothetical protein ADEAN_000977500 [Angomonas deanei]